MTSFGNPVHGKVYKLGAAHPAKLGSQSGRRVPAALLERSFDDRIDKSGDCWLWKGKLHIPNGYARVSYGRYGGAFFVHRIMYEQVVGPIPRGYTIDHLCRNHRCVNPAHLEAVPQRTNTLRSPYSVGSRHLRKTHCIWGHAFDETNTRLEGPDGTDRRCRACERERSRRRKRTVVA